MFTAALMATLLCGTDAEPRRFAIAIGENTGAARDEVLRYATSDAHRMLEVLRDVGGVRPEDAVEISGADASAVRAALAAFEARLAKEATEQDQLFVYVSAHAAAGELRLRGTFLPMHELAELARRAPVAVAVLIIDSCRSGDLTRAKGLKALPGTAVSFEAPEVSGRVIITSSGGDESSQESDALQGSYFTHHLLAGMRGAADRSRDGRVTLEEAYAYAYSRTVESTFATQAGSQHPTYSVDLKGRGELVLSQLQGIGGRLEVDVTRSGEWLVLESGSGSVVGQFYKDEGPAVFAVPAGTYLVRARVESGHRQATVVVPQGGTAKVSSSIFVQGELIRAPRKGDGRSLWSLGVSVLVGTPAISGVGAMPGIEARARWWLPRALLFVQSLSLFASYRGAGAEGAPDFVQREWDLALGPGHTFTLGIVDIHLAAHGGVVLTSQSGLAGGSSRVSLQPQAAGSLELEVIVYRGITAFIGGHAGAVWVNVEDLGVTPFFRGAASGGLALDL